MGFSLMGNGKIGSGLIGMGLFGGNDDEESLPPPPEYFTDPNYKNEQDFLQPYGQNLLNGNIPDYYKSVGESGSPQFESMLSLSNRDISQGAADAAARTGRGRGGSLPSVTAQAIGDNTTKLRFADFLNSQEGKKFLMTQGRGISEGVRNSGQTEGARRNSFNLDSYDRTIGNIKYQTQRDDAAAAANGEAIGKLFGAGVGAVGGFMTGGPVGAVLGGVNGLTGGGMGDLFKLGKEAGGLFGNTTTQDNTASTAAGVSKLGGISPDDLMKYYNLNKN